MLCIRTDVFPIECVVRGYLTGIRVEGVPNRAALSRVSHSRRDCVESDRFDPPRFSPATKAETGHDENIPMSEMRRQLGVGPAEALESHEPTRVRARP